MAERVQTGALPWRKVAGKGLEVLLVTSRWSARWIVPKGWPMRGKSLAQAAAQEAFEEAGVKGRVATTPLGSFQHVKNHPLGKLEVSILVHALSVERELDRWPERGQRQRRWFDPDRAAELVDSDELKSIILKLKQGQPELS